MRGFTVLVAYVAGLLAVVSIGIISLMALQSSIKPSSTVPTVATGPHKERPGKSVSQTIVGQKGAHPSGTRKVTHVTRKRKGEAPNIASSGLNAYGYAQESHRIHGYPFSIFGR